LLVAVLEERVAMKRRLLKAIGIVFCLGLVLTGGVMAYFTSKATTQQVVVGTGSLAITIDETTPLQFDNLLPGEEKIISWTVTNTGSTPVNIKGKIQGLWEDEALTGGLLATSVEAQVAGEWLSLLSVPTGINQEFFFSSTGQENALISLAKAESLPMRLKLQFDSQAPDEYQNQTYNLSVHLAAKQTNAGANWPESY